VNPRSLISCELNEWRNRPGRVTVSVNPEESGRLGLSWEIEVLAIAEAKRTQVQFVEGEAHAVRAPARELWRENCCEFFCGPTGQLAYIEWNIAFSGEWNCYAFVSERSRASIDPPGGVIEVRRQIQGGRVRLQATLEIPNEWRALDLEAQPAVVLSGDDISYWSSRHEGDRPDFHDRRRWSWRRLASDWSQV
jgi:hypothetical protein